MTPIDPPLACAGRLTTITVPGLGGSGPALWQTLWERTRPDTKRAELGRWDDPDRDIWVRRLDEAIQACRGSVVLVGHSLGCFAIAWWAALAPQRSVRPVLGALLVAPPDLDRPEAPTAVGGFAPSPRTILPFRSTMVGSSADPWSTLSAVRDLASAWGSHFVAINGGGHLNAASGLGSWPIRGGTTSPADNRRRLVPSERCMNQGAEQSWLEPAHAIEALQYLSSPQPAFTLHSQCHSDRSERTA